MASSATSATTNGGLQGGEGGGEGGGVPAKAKVHSRALIVGALLLTMAVAALAATQVSQWAALVPGLVLSVVAWHRHLPPQRRTACRCVPRVCTE